MEKPQQNQIAHRNRKSIRLKGFDYTRSGSYFVTIVTHGRRCLFGYIAEGDMHLNLAGLCAQAILASLSLHFPVEALASVVMPNHIHVVIYLRGNLSEASGTYLHVPESSQLPDASTLEDGQFPHGTKPASLGSIVQNYKSVTSRKINQIFGTEGKTIWQRGYYDRVIRDERELENARHYIEDNPRRWIEDQEYMKNP